MITNPTIGMRVLYFNRVATITHINSNYIEVNLDIPWNTYTRWSAEPEQLSELTPETQEQERRRLHADKYL